MFFAGLPTGGTLLVGLTDQAEEGVWKLFNGEPATYFAWESVQEGNGGTNENHVRMFSTKYASTHSRTAGGWVDIGGFHIVTK